MGPGIVEITNVCGKDPEQVVLVEDDHVIEALAAYATEEPLAVRVHVGRAYRGLDDANSDGFSCALEVRAELIIPIANEESRALSESCGIPESLRPPRA